MTTKLKVLAAFSLLIIAVGCKEKQSEKVDTKTTYELLTIKTDSAEVLTSYTASIQGKQDINIYSQVSGYLAEIKVEEGDVVNKGEVLFVIEQAPFKAAYEAAKASVLAAEANVANAELNYSNTNTLNEKGIVSDTELQSAKNNLAAAKASLEMAKAQMASAKVNLDFTLIKSPSNGVVGTLPFRQGALVSPSVSLTVVSDNSEMYVYFSMSENQVLELIEKYGSMEGVLNNFPPVGLELSNGSVYSEKGKIEAISGVIDQSTGSISLRANFTNPQRRLLSGGAGNIILENTFENIILVPKSATFEVQDKIFVYRVINKKASSTLISVQKGPNDEVYIVKDGLKTGDIIIARGAGLVREGTPINQ